MSNVSLAAPSEAGVRVFSGSELRRFAMHTHRLGFDLSANIVRNRGDDVKYEEVSLRLLRLYTRSLMHTELLNCRVSRG